MIEEREIVSQSTYQPPQVTQPLSGYQAVYPRITNYYSPKINVQSSPTPSDSLERFKQNKKFTIGEWVYSQYVDGFKRGNLYYRPVYDKGYNFSRRYILGVTSLPSRPHSLLKLLMITTHNHLSVEKMNQTSIHLINYQL